MAATTPPRAGRRFSQTVAALCPQGRIASKICDPDSSVELDQVLEDQWTPAISARLHKQSAFRKPAKCDRRETEILRKRTSLRCGAVIVVRQEHDSLPPCTDGSWSGTVATKMVEAPTRTPGHQVPSAQASPARAAWSRHATRRQPCWSGCPWHRAGLTGARLVRGCRKPCLRGLTASLEGDVMRIEVQGNPVIPINYTPIVIYATPYSVLRIGIGLTRSRHPTPAPAGVSQTSV